jgi:hypothetical protein
MEQFSIFGNGAADSPGANARAHQPMLFYMCTFVDSSQQVGKAKLTVVIRTPKKRIA